MNEVERKKAIQQLEALLEAGVAVKEAITMSLQQHESNPAAGRMIPVPKKALDRFEAALFTPDTKAWMRVNELLRQAMEDPVISVNADAIQFLEFMEALSGPAWGHWGLSRVLAPVAKAVKSNLARMAASQKNEKARATVLLRWEQREDKDQSKAAFARCAHYLVKKEFGLNVTADTIARDWLPKAKK